MANFFAPPTDGMQRLDELDEEERMRIGRQLVSMAVQNPGGSPFGNMSPRGPQPFASPQQMNPYSSPMPQSFGFSQQQQQPQLPRPSMRMPPQMQEVLARRGISPGIAAGRAQRRQEPMQRMPVRRPQRQMPPQRQMSPQRSLYRPLHESEEESRPLYAFNPYDMGA